MVEGGVEDAGEADRQHRQQVGRQDAAPAHDTVPGTPFIVSEVSTGLHSVRRKPLVGPYKQKALIGTWDHLWPLRKSR